MRTSGSCRVTSRKNPRVRSDPDSDGRWRLIAHVLWILVLVQKNQSVGEKDFWSMLSHEFCKNHDNNFIKKSMVQY